MYEFFLRLNRNITGVNVYKKFFDPLKKIACTLNEHLEAYILLNYILSTLTCCLVIGHGNAFDTSLQQ